MKYKFKPGDKVLISADHPSKLKGTVGTIKNSYKTGGVKEAYELHECETHFYPVEDLKLSIVDVNEQKFRKLLK